MGRSGHPSFSSKETAVNVQPSPLVGILVLVDCLAVFYGVWITLAGNEASTRSGLDISLSILSIVIVVVPVRRDRLPDLPTPASSLRSSGARWTS